LYAVIQFKHDVFRYDVTLYSVVTRNICSTSIYSLLLSCGDPLAHSCGRLFSEEMYMYMYICLVIAKATRRANVSLYFLRVCEVMQ